MPGVAHLWNVGLGELLQHVLTDEPAVGDLHCWKPPLLAELGDGHVAGRQPGRSFCGRCVRLEEVVHNAIVNPSITLPEVNDTTDVTITLTVTDNDNQQSSDDVIITINNVLIPPIAEAGPETDFVAEDSTYILDGSVSSDPNGNIISYLWSSESPEIVFIDPNSSVASFIAPLVDADTDFTITLTVTDNDNQQASDNIIVTVQNVVLGVPEANAGPDATINEGDTVILDGTGSSDEPPGEVVSYNWSSPPEITLDDSTSSTPSFTAPLIDLSQISYSFTLTVTDDEGQESNPDNVVITILNVLISPVSNAGEDVAVNELLTVQD